MKYYESVSLLEEKSKSKCKWWGILDQFSSHSKVDFRDFSDIKYRSLTRMSFNKYYTISFTIILDSLSDSYNDYYIDYSEKLYCKTDAIYGFGWTNPEDIENIKTWSPEIMVYDKIRLSYLASYMDDSIPVKLHVYYDKNT